MNKEQQELLDEAYKNYFNKTKDLTKDSFEAKGNGVIVIKGFDLKSINQYGNISGTISNSYFIPYTQEEFINKCKTDTEFSERWGLKIEERELDMMERWEIADLTPNMEEFDFANYMCDIHNVPTKLITITYNDKTKTVFRLKMLNVNWDEPKAFNYDIIKNVTYNDKTIESYE
jgi:hypothetical protein